MNTLFQFTNEMKTFILDLWVENIENNNGTRLTNIILYKNICEAFNRKFNLNIIYYKIGTPIVYEKMKYNAVSNMIYNVIYNKLQNNLICILYLIL